MMGINAMFYLLGCLFGYLVIIVTYLIPLGVRSWFALMAISYLFPFHILVTFDNVVWVMVIIWMLRMKIYSGGGCCIWADRSGK